MALLFGPGHRKHHSYILSSKNKAVAHKEFLSMPSLVQNEDDENSTPSSTSTKMSGVVRPHENDVLMGRGGKNNQHSGNEKLREFARERCDDYQRASKKGKSRISKELVEIVRKMDPPGRYDCPQISRIFTAP
jgi:hypothetical protein